MTRSYWNRRPRTCAVIKEDDVAKTKTDLLAEAQGAGVVASDATEDDYTADELNARIRGDVPAWKGSLSAGEPIVAADGHVVLSQEDLDARQ